MRDPRSGKGLAQNQWSRFPLCNNCNDALANATKKTYTYHFFVREINPKKREIQWFPCVVATKKTTTKPRRESLAKRNFLKRSLKRTDRPCRWIGLTQSEKVGVDAASEIRA